MTIVYFFLALLAVVFSLFGFLLRAFYFGSKTEARLSAEVEGVRRNLEVKQRASKEAKEETIRLNAMIHKMEEQEQQRNNELETLKLLASRQDEEIKLLQKDAEIIRMAISGRSNPEITPEQISPALLAGIISENSGTPMKAPAGQPLSDASKHPQRTGQPRDSDRTGPRGAYVAEKSQTGPLRAVREPLGDKRTVPAEANASGGSAWKEDLDNILNTLESMEKEVQK